MTAISLIGYGEAAQAFTSDTRWAGAASVYDILTDDPARAAAKRADYARANVTGCATLAEALAEATTVLSLVTADQSLAVAQSAVAHIAPSALYFDLNSVAPGTKQAAAALIEAAGGRFVDVAVMAPVYPTQLAAPLLVSGPHATDGCAALTRLGFINVREVGEAIGRASTIKMLRSVMYKGMESLTAECLIACEKAGVTDEVLGSFGADWATDADYRLDRMMVHGLRRSAEMYESVKTLESLGVEPLMTRGTAARQAEIGGRRIAVPPVTLKAKLERLCT